MSETENVQVSEMSVISEEAVEALADSFLELQKELPELESVADLPEAVWEAAYEGNIPLMDAYLRYCFREERAVLAEQERQKRAAQAAAGSLSGNKRARPVSDAFARSFKQALQ